MKEGWIKAKLDEICDINYGTRVVQKKDGGTIYPVYGGGGATFRIDKYNREDCLIVSRFAMSSLCVRFVKGKFFLNDSGLTIESKSKKVKQDFLDKQILALNDKIYSLGKGVAQKNLDIKELKQVVLSYPSSTSEQERIVSELDCLSDIIEKQKQQLKELDNLAQSIFYTTFGDPISNNFGWEKVSFDQLCHSMTKGPFGSDIKKSLYVEKSESTYKVYIQANAIDKDLSKGDYYISQEYFDEKMFRFEVHPYDYIITCDGTLGKFIRLPQVIEKGIISASLLRLSLNEEYLEPKYFEFIWDAYMLPLLIKDVRNTALKHLPSASKIGKVSIPLPSISKQKEFASKIEAIEKQKEIIKQSIEETETLFNSRMDYYFN